MALIHLTQYWPPVDIEAVALTQDVAAAGSVVFNGNLVTPLNPNTVSFLSHGFIRSVMISSANDLSAATFTVTGSQNGVEVTEDIPGPVDADNPTYTTASFDVITSITVDIDVAGVQIGTGRTGYLPPIKVNASSTPGAINRALQIRLSPEDGIFYRELSTTFEIINIGTTFDNILANINLFDVGVERHESQLIINRDGPLNYIVIQITTSVIGASTITLDFMQV